MNLTEYLSWIFSAESEAAILCLVLTLSFVLAVIGDLIAGIRRGALKQILHTAISAGSVFISYFTTNILLGVLHDYLSTTSVADMLAIFGDSIPENTRNILSTLNPEVAEELLMLPTTTIIAPIIFVVLYYIIRLILSLIFIFVNKLLPEINNLSSRTLGALISAVEAVVISSLMLLPFVAIVDVTADAISHIDSSSEAASEITDVYEEYLEPVSSCPMFELTRVLGGEAILTSFSVTELDGEKIDMRDQFNVAIEVLNHYIKLNGVDLGALTDENKAAFTSIVETATESPYYAKLVSGLLNMLATSADLGYIELGSEPPFDLLINDVIAIFKTSDGDNVSADLTTVKNVFFILSDSGLLASASSADGAKDAFTKKDENGNTVVNLVITELELNERTRPLITTITKLSVAIIADSMDMGEEVTAVYENVKDGINNTLSIKRENYNSDEEHEAAVSESINNTLVENGITLEPEIVDSITDYYFEAELDQLDELTDDDVNDLILSYYDAYLEYIEGSN